MSEIYLCIVFFKIFSGFFHLEKTYYSLQRASLKWIRYCFWNSFYWKGYFWNLECGILYDKREIEKVSERRARSMAVGGKSWPTGATANHINTLWWIFLDLSCPPVFSVRSKSSNVNGIWRVREAHTIYAWRKMRWYIESKHALWL